jgi:hypothetical protein
LKEGYPEYVLDRISNCSKRKSKILDYSELITHIEAGKGGKLLI